GERGRRGGGKGDPNERAVGRPSGKLAHAADLVAELTPRAMPKRDFAARVPDRALHGRGASPRLHGETPQGSLVALDNAGLHARGSADHGLRRGESARRTTE